MLGSCNESSRQHGHLVTDLQTSLDNRKISLNGEDACPSWLDMDCWASWRVVDSTITARSS